MACTCRRNHMWIFACMCSSRRLSLGMPRIGAACGTSTTWTSRRWCRRYQHGGTGSSSAQCRWEEEVACARWHRGQCAMWMGGADIWGRPPRPHTAQRGWRSANALQAQQSQPRADPAWLSGGGQTTQTPEGPEGGGAVQTHCRLSRASRQQTPYGNGVGCGCGHVWKAEREHVCVWCVCVVWQERVYFKMPNVPCPNVPMSSIVQCPMSQCNVPMMSQCPMSQCPYVPSH